MIRLMQKEDIEDVLVIENASFVDPWTYGIFMDDLFNEISYNIVYFQDEKLVGYGCSWLMYDELHITNLCVKKEYRGQGIAKKMMNVLLEKAMKVGLDKSLLEVRVSNESAINLYENLGFRVIYRARDYYENGEDAYIMEKFLE